MTAHGLLRSLTLVSALGAGLVAGVFFAFSTFVMKGLDRTPAPGGLTAMQAINRAAPTPLFMLALFGTALTCTVLGVSAFFRLDEPVARYQLAGCALVPGRDRAHRRVPRPAQRRARRGQPAERGRGRDVVALRHQLDRVEPRPHGDVVRRRGGAHPRRHA